MYVGTDYHDIVSITIINPSNIGLNLLGPQMTNLIYGRAAAHLIFLRAHLPCIPAMVFKISPELQILTRNRILPNMRQKEERQTRAEDAESAADEEGILATSQNDSPGRTLDDALTLPSGESIAYLSRELERGGKFIRS